MNMKPGKNKEKNELPIEIDITSSKISARSVQIARFSTNKMENGKKMYDAVEL